MPFVIPCTRKYQKDEENQQAVLLGIEKLANAGYCHEDLRVTTAKKQLGNNFIDGDMLDCLEKNNNKCCFI